MTEDDDVAELIVNYLTIASQRQFSDEVLAYEGKRPTRQRIAKMYGACFIEAESEAA